MHFDDFVMEKHHEEIGCSAPYHNSSKPFCTTKEKLKEFMYEVTKVKTKYFPPPCQAMSTISYTSVNSKESKKINKANVTTLSRPYFYYPNKIKMITQSQSIDVQALIGNIGGYIGLFLGKILL